MKPGRRGGSPGLLPAVLLSLFFLTACAGSAPALRSDHIEKAEGDPRSYRHLRLANGLKALLVSDPGTERAAVAMDVAAGSREEPSEYPGLAHLLEHALFLGTESYPEPYEFHSFLSSNGGVYNALTAFEYTSYFFALNAAALELALDRFAELFSAPLLLPRRIAEESQVVDAEYRSRLRSEELRLLDVFRVQLNPAHPYARFAVGSMDTLEGGSAAAAAFYRRFYIAPGMALALSAPLPLAELEALVLSKFRTLPEGETPPRLPNVPLFAPDTLPRRVFLQPVRELRALRLVFPVSKAASENRDSPLHHIAELLGDEGEGSLLSHLKREGLAEALRAGPGLRYREGGTFDVDIQLTAAGLGSLEEVAVAVFDTLEKIRATGLNPWRLQERHRTAEIAWQFREVYSAEKEVWRLARNLQKYPAREVLRGEYLAEDFSGEELAAQLDFLVPDNCLWLVTAPGTKGEQSSPWYAVPYREERIFPAPLRARLQAPLSRDIQLPPPNPYLLGLPALGALPPRPAPAASPQLVLARESLELWHLADQNFPGPRGHAYFDLRFPDALGTAEKAALTVLLARVLADEWSEKVWPAVRAGLHAEISPSLRGMTLELHGFHRHQVKLLGELVQVLRQPVLAAERVAAARETLLHRWQSAGRGAPYRRLLGDFSQALVWGRWPEAALAAALARTTPEDLSRFAREALGDVRIRGLVQGGMALPAALQMGSLAASIAKRGAQSSSPTRVGRIGAGERWRWSRRLPHGDAAILLYLQAPDDTDRSRAFAALSARVLEADFFQEMRIKRQLGYVVFSTYYPLLDIPGIVFAMQSPTVSARDLEAELEVFLKQAATEGAGGGSPEYFVRHRQALLQSLQQRPENGGLAAARNWQSILLGDREFVRRQSMVQALQESRWEDWRKFHRDLMRPGSRREILLLASAMPSEEEEEGPYSVDSPESLWHSLSSWYSR